MHIQNLETHSATGEIFMFVTVGKVSVLRIAAYLGKSNFI